MKAKKRILVVDDSPFMRKLIVKSLESRASMEVIGVARDGNEAIEKIKELHPDAVTLDIQMPKMDGLTALKIIMRECPLPVVIVSSLSQEQADITLECLETGAVDFILKPSDDILMSRQDQMKELALKVFSACNIDVSHFKKNESPSSVSPKLYTKPVAPLYKKESVSIGSSFEKIVVIGISTGGPKNLLDVVPELPGYLNAYMFVIQHMPEFFTKSFADRLNHLSKIQVKETEDGEMIRKGVVYIARGGFHTKVLEMSNKKYYVKHVDNSRENNLYVPSVDVTIESIAPIFRSRAIGVLMTGMGRDGVDGLKSIKGFLGQTIAESKETAVIYGMPGVAVEEGCADFILPSYRIAEKIVELVDGTT
ncbi:MAG: chemotaxis response regulator protein-glutamate methylesterase [Leptospiraceae bacterium]|nr:chemotaxis response regulator protein-glutamate methylesterase [Leptospiraceae bacterium]MCP5492997.1 chemotaxis response regulator protein-glutamate methylesterase [Leptospiraceae bacterium]